MKFHVSGKTNIKTTVSLVTIYESLDEGSVRLISKKRTLEVIKTSV